MEIISVDDLTEQLNGLARTYYKSISVDSSYAGEYEYISKIVKELNLTAGFVVDVAASDGVTQSCTLGFFKDPEWQGLAVEMNPISFSKLAFVYSNFENAKLARSRVVPKSICPLLRGFEVPRNFDLLNLDIDSYDLDVIDAMLSGGFRPKIISMEINEKIPPTIFFSVNYDDGHYWKGDHFFGCSLAAAAKVVRPYGYILESLQYNNAIFVRSDLGLNIFQDLNVVSAYESGYKNRIDRKRLFPWNEDVECLLEDTEEKSMEFTKQLFKKHTGMFELYIV